MYSADESKRDPILAAVGQLQFEVVQFRLQNEYGVESLIEPLPYSVARWVAGGLGSPRESWSPVQHRDR